jgi:hypothetical protein
VSGSGTDKGLGRSGSRPRQGSKRHSCFPLLVLDSPIVGMVVTISPNFSLYRMVVLPAASKPTATEKGGGGGKEWRRERGSPLEPRDRERPGQLMVMGAESRRASRCALFSTFRALRAVWVASANSCPSSARGARGAREVGDLGGRPRSFEKSFPRAESSLLSSRAGAEEASPHPGPSSGFQAQGRHCRSWFARERGPQRLWRWGVSGSGYQVSGARGTRGREGCGGAGAPSGPRARSASPIRIRICFFPKIREKSADTVRPMAGPGAGARAGDAGRGLEPAGRGGMGRNSRRRRRRRRRRRHLRASGSARRHVAPPLRVRPGPAPQARLRKN